MNYFFHWSTFVNISRVKLARYEKVDIADNGKDKKILHKAKWRDPGHTCRLGHLDWIWLMIVGDHTTQYQYIYNIIYI